MDVKWSEIERLYREEKGEVDIGLITFVITYGAVWLAMIGMGIILHLKCCGS